MGQGTSSCSNEICKHTAEGHSIVISKKHEDFTSFLPDECLAKVFGSLGSHDRNSCSLVCKRWRAVDSESRYRLVLLAPCEMSQSLPALLSRFSSVSVLSLKCSRKLLSINDFAFSHIPVLLVSLKKLKLKGCIDISDDGLQAFSLHRPPFLSKLSFASCGFGVRGLNSLITNCPSLQHLTLKRLRKLDAHITTLKTLIVCRSSGNWDKVLQSLQASITSVSEIQMENVQMGDAGLIAISSSCPYLQVLQLSRTTDCTDDGLSAVANSCKNLRKVHIDAWSRFGGRTIGDEGLLTIANHCSRLQELVLMGVHLSVSSLTVLASNCRELERLAICNADSVGDPEMALIAEKFSALKKLCIKNCPISEPGIEAIGSGCPNLVKLKVKRCRGISQESIKKLKMQRSWLVVSIDAGPIIDHRWISSPQPKARLIRTVHNLKASKSLPRARSRPKTGFQSDSSIRPTQLFWPNEQIPSGPNFIFRLSSEPGRSSAHLPCGTIRMRARVESGAVTHGAAI
uniref:F-box domain-containing protein n=1 Tax=Manihot esculenta TaxID=3983 RepID=A0A2C9WG60_MANES